MEKPLHRSIMQNIVYRRAYDRSKHQSIYLHHNNSYSHNNSVHTKVTLTSNNSAYRYLSFVSHHTVFNYMGGSY